MNYKDPIIAAGKSAGEISPGWLSLGFKFGDTGAHTSRTIMLADLSTVLRQRPATATRANYAAAVVDENCLGKHTASTRKLSLQRLSELYSLDPSVPLFRLLRFFWAADEKAHGQLALLAALCRDPLLRATAPVVLRMKPGEEVARQQFTDVLRDAVAGRLNDSILDKVVRNTASSWTQSGHLDGRSRKRRVRIQPTPASTAFALVLGYLLGIRGRSLFDTFFARILDRDADELVSLAMDAKRLGFLDIKSGGGMTVVSFDSILNQQEKEIANGTH
jgi:hypothetical protein